MRYTSLIILLSLATVSFFLPGALLGELTTDEVIAKARTYLDSEKELTAEEIIAKARDYLGSDDKLRGIRTIQYSGVFESPANGDTGYISIYLRKPLMQRMVVVNGVVTETTAINDFDGWKSRTNKNDPDGWAMFILNLSEMKRMRANTWENLNFFEGIEHLKGRIINKGKLRKDSRDAHLLVFEYDDDIYYERYFDAKTGELISTINDKGVEIKEVGEILENGIRFPEKVITLVDGEVINQVTFHEILLNEELDESIFDFPSLYPTILSSSQDSVEEDIEEVQPGENKP